MIKLLPYERNKPLWDVLFMYLCLIYYVFPFYFLLWLPGLFQWSHLWTFFSFSHSLALSPPVPPSHSLSHSSSRVSEYGARRRRCLFFFFFLLLDLRFEPDHICSCPLVSVSLLLSLLTSYTCEEKETEPYLSFNLPAWYWCNSLS